MSDKKRINGLGRTGAVINIIFAVTVVILFLVLFVNSIQFYMFYKYDVIIYDVIIKTVLFALFITFGLFSFAKNVRLLKGKLDKKRSAIVFGFLTLSVIGSIFLIYSKEVVPIKKVIDKHVAEELTDLITKYKSLLDSGVITEEDLKI
ncbi:MAG: hypothetical protein K0Q49_1969 [Haloplasmataceae bacterium]|jgi:membrane protease YdiL (CAAX protease family)|nr:hypothetical protein [Haloplasmataceae bacterium]